MTAQWSNWSGSVSCSPARIVSPSNAREVVAAIRDARKEERQIRTRGAGHSFSPLCACDDLLVDPGRLTGIEAVDADHRWARIRAGTRVSDIGEPLNRAGLALSNQGDIDLQTMAGALATGTHGTGLGFGSMSAQVRGLSLACADGLVRRIGPDDELLDAARISLGALGIVVDVTVDLVPKYLLEERSWASAPETTLQAFSDLASAHRNLEFFWLPECDICVLKALDEVNGPQSSEEEMRAPSAPPGKVARYLRCPRIHWSHRIYPSERAVPFNEMEFAVPEEAGPSCFRAIRSLMRESFPAVRWAVEYRTLAAESAFLAQSYQRNSVCISIHEDAKLDCRPFFRAAEAVFLDHGGRPHWGKWHFLGADMLAPLYPRWNDFLATRRKLDPDGLFLNDHLKQLFGL